MGKKFDFAWKSDWVWFGLKGDGNSICIWLCCSVESKICGYGIMFIILVGFG